MLPDATAFYRPFVDALIIIPTIILFTRLSGLRSFSKLSGYDFAITVAFGSVIASVVVGKDTSYATGISALAALFTVQFALSKLRIGSEAAENGMDNCPLLLMDGSNILGSNLKKAKVTQADLMAKLREANVMDFGEVRAVVMETTGDISVLHGDKQRSPLQKELLEGVER